MTTFKEIRGTAIESVSTDPTNPEVGQIWYNSSSGTLKGYLFANVNAWSSGGNLNTARTYIGSTGTQTAGLAFGGYVAPTTGATELYNGTSWTSSPNSMATARSGLGNAGTQTAGLAFGGGTPSSSSATEEWTGASVQVRTITTS